MRRPRTLGTRYFFFCAASSDEEEEVEEFDMAVADEEAVEPAPPLLTASMARASVRSCWTNVVCSGLPSTAVKSFLHPHVLVYFLSGSV